MSDPTQRLRAAIDDAIDWLDHGDPYAAEHALLSALSTTPAPDRDRLLIIEEASRAVIGAEDLIDHCEDHDLRDLDDALEARNRSIDALRAALDPDHPANRDHDDEGNHV